MAPGPPNTTSMIGPSNAQANNASTKSQTEPPRFSWDNEADQFALSAHHTGKTKPQIKAQLALNGYKYILKP